MYFCCKYFGLLKDLVGKAILLLQYMHVIMKNYQGFILNLTIIYYNKY